MEPQEIVLCPHCSAANRLARARLTSAPNCGKCHAPLFLGKPVEMDDAAMAAHITKGTLPLLVDFWAPWCQPCRMMAPAFAEAAARLEPFMRLAKVNTEQQQTLAATYAIRSIPTMILIAGGKEIRRISGAMDSRRIVDWALAV